MRALSATDILAIWEDGVSRSLVERTLALASHALPGATWDELFALPLGRRDALLLELRTRTLGERVVGFDQCPACSERLEIAVSTAELLAGAGRELPREARVQWVERAGFRLGLRLPDSWDVLAIGGLSDAEAATACLLRRCVLRAERDGVEVEPDALPPEVRAEIDAWMAAQDPLAEVRLALRCPACAHTWQTALDVGEFLWAEVAARARRLTVEVHTLAKAYGWRERDILAMSPVRRQTYLDLLGTS